VVIALQREFLVQQVKEVLRLLKTGRTGFLLGVLQIAQKGYPPPQVLQTARMGSA
jgi:hypothetical protein